MCFSVNEIVSSISNRYIYFLVYTLLLLTVQLGNASDVIFQKEVGTAISRVTLFSDSTFTVHSNISYPEGSLFEILSVSALEHEDDAQNQKFKWYEVKTVDGNRGWVFGDGIAVIMPIQRVPQLMKNYHKKRVDYGPGFEKSVIWMAGIEGRDNFHKEDVLNPPYHEHYIVVTNDLGRSIHMPLSMMSTQGETSLARFEVYPVPGEPSPLFLLESLSLSNGSSLALRHLGIFAIKAGSLEKVFAQQMTLTAGAKSISPAVKAHVLIEEDLIRVEYVDYEKTSKQNGSKRLKKTDSYYMDYVTSTYRWNQRSKSYRPVYPENHSLLKGFVDAGTAYFADLTIEHPSTSKDIIEFKVVKQVLHTYLGQKELFLQVRRNNGESVYVRAKDVSFFYCWHAPILEAFYDQKYKEGRDWRYKADYLTIEHFHASTVNSEG